MSTTGSLYAELWKDNQWEPIPKPKRSKGKSLPARAQSLGAQYELFAALIGYHHHSLDFFDWHTEKIVPLSEPRGLPKDMNPVYKEYFENNSVGIEHHFTWFMVQEVIEYDWDKKFLPCTGYIDSRYAYLFQNSGCFPQDLPNNEPVYKYKKDNTTEVSRVDTYRDYVGCVEWLIEELLKLGNPKEVRLILWLHC